MKHKLLLLSLAALLFGWCGAYATPIIGDEDLLWTKYISKLEDVKFHPSGETVVASIFYQGLWVLDAETGDSLRTFTHNLPISSVNSYFGYEISSCGNYLFAIDYTQRCFLWDYSTGQLLRGFDQIGWRVSHSSSTNQFLVIGPNEQEQFWVYDVALDSVILMKSASEMGLFQRLLTIAASPDGRYFALGSLYDPGSMSSTQYSLAVYDATTFQKIVDIEKRETGGFGRVVISESSKWLAYGSTIIDLERLIANGEKIIVKKYWPYSHLFDKSEKYVFECYDGGQTRLLDIVTNDTLLIFNYWTGKGDISNKNNNIVFTSRGWVLMFNSNWYYLDVEDPIVETIIPILSYTGATLNYSVNIQNPISIKITNSTGTTLYINSENISSYGTIYIPLASGVYFIIVNDGNRDYVEKFIVVN